MKFRDYIGKSEVRRVKKKIINTVDCKSKIVKKEQFKKMSIGCDIDKYKLKRFFDYIKSWLIRYNVSYMPINPHLILYTFRHKHIPNITNEINLNKTVLYKPKGSITIVSKNFPKSGYDLREKADKDYILLDYHPNEYNLFLESIFIDKNIKTFFNQCYIKLFEIESGILTSRIYEDIMYSTSKIPTLNLNDIKIRSK